MSIILNAFKARRGYGYSPGYDYGQKYEGYYEDQLPIEKGLYKQNNFGKY